LQRLIATTCINPDESIDGRALRDLPWRRLFEEHIHVPPVRERPDDIPMLLDHFRLRCNWELNLHCPGFDPNAVDALRSCPWPGNVREIKNVVERAVLRANGRLISLDDLDSMGEDMPSTSTDLRDAVQRFERRLIRLTLKSARGDKRIAARLLGIGRSSLYRKLKELGLAECESSARSECST
jgi:DNA-binding NtrC family response regulator